MSAEEETLPSLRPSRPLVPIFTALALSLSALACDFNGLASRSGGDDEDDEMYTDAICIAAEAVDDTCEAEFGEDVEECAPFDDVDEACEAGDVPDECATAEALDDACELLFGEDAPECAPLDDLDEACEAEYGDDDDDDADDSDSDSAG